MCSITGSWWLSIEKFSHQAQHVHACALAPSLDEGVYKARPSQHKPQQMHAGKFQQKMFFLTCNAYQTHSRTPTYSKNSLQLPLFFLYTLYVQDEQTDLTLHQLHPKTLFEIAMVLSTNRGSFPSNSHVSATFSILLRFGESCVCVFLHILRLRISSHRIPAFAYFFTSKVHCGSAVRLGQALPGYLITAHHMYACLL